MVVEMTHKQVWRKDGTLQYIKVETRPARKSNDSVCQMDVEWLPNGNSGGCEAFQSLLKTSIAQRTHEEATKFYSALKDFADRYRNNGHIK